MEVTWRFGSKNFKLPFHKPPNLSKKPSQLSDFEALLLRSTFLFTDSVLEGGMGRG